MKYEKFDVNYRIITYFHMACCPICGVRLTEDTLS